MVQQSVGVAQPSLKVISGWPSRLYGGVVVLVLDLIGTWFGLGLGGLGTKSLGTGLDNKAKLLHNFFQPSS